MRVLIQQKRGRYPTIDYYSAALGFEELGYEVKLIEQTDLETMDVGNNAMPVGEIPVLLAVFSRLKIPYKPLSYIPDELFAFAGRRTWRATLGEVRSYVAAGQPVFAKPLAGNPRLFKGQVLRAYRDLIRTAHFDSETPVWCSDLVDFVSEYRVFVCEREIVGVKHYCGEFRTFVDWRAVEEAMSLHQEPPAGFAIDFGVTRAGETLIVEQNDGFSLGSYGLHHVTYAKLLEARWSELTAKMSKAADAGLPVKTGREQTGVWSRAGVQCELLLP